MRHRILPPSLITALLLLSANQMFAQSNVGYAITGATKGNIAWMTVREIDLSTGREIRTIYSPESKPLLVDAVSGTRLQPLNLNAPVNNAVTTINRNGISNTIVTYGD